MHGISTHVDWLYVVVDRVLANSKPEAVGDCTLSAQPAAAGDVVPPSTELGVQDTSLLSAATVTNATSALDGSMPTHSTAGVDSHEDIGMDGIEIDAGASPQQVNNPELPADDDYDDVRMNDAKNDTNASAQQGDGADNLELPADPSPTSPTIVEASKHAPAPRLDADGLTYEEAREKNIAANRALLSSLGLDNISDFFAGGSKSKSEGSNGKENGQQPTSANTRTKPKAQGKKTSTRAKSSARRSKRGEKCVNC